MANEIEKENKAKELEAMRARNVEVTKAVTTYVAKGLWSGLKIGTKFMLSSKEERKEEKQWKKELERKVKEEEALAKVRNTSMLKMYESQVELMIKGKEAGANIDKEIFAMREKLLILEGQENKAMIQELLETLNGL
jgi:hypothetical protein